MYTLELFNRDGTEKSVDHDLEGLWELNWNAGIALDMPLFLTKPLSDERTRLKRTSHVKAFNGNDQRKVIVTTHSIYVLEKSPDV